MILEKILKLSDWLSETVANLFEEYYFSAREQFLLQILICILHTAPGI